MPMTICEQCTTRYALPFREDWSAAVCYACDHYRPATNVSQQRLDEQIRAKIARDRDAARVAEIRRWNWITS